MRHGSRIAAAPPGIGHGAQVADALEPLEPGHQQLATPECAVGAVPEAVERERDDGIGAACSTMHAATWAWWCCTPSVGRSRSRANFADRYSGCRSCATSSGVTPYERGQVRDRLEEGLVGREVLEVAEVVAGHDLAPRVTATVHFSSAPTASTVPDGAPAARSGSGAYPRDRRSTWSRAGGPARRSRRTGCGSAGRG